MKHTLLEVASHHTDYSVLIPPAWVLHNGYDPAYRQASSKARLHDYCYQNDEFVRSHIIKTSASISSTITPVSKVQLVVYNTINGKQILIKNGLVFTGKGFKRSLKLKITEVAMFASFASYLPRGSKFMVMYIEDSLVGSYLKDEPTLIPMPLSVSRTKQPVESVTFEDLLRNFPLLSKAVSDKFYRLFHHNNHQFRLLRTQTRKKVGAIKVEFQAMLDEAYHIISDSVKSNDSEAEQTYDVIHNVLEIYPGLDLNRIVHDYMELNLYDQLWSQLVFQFNANSDNWDAEAVRVLTLEKYQRLSCLSLNQLELPVSEPWHLNQLHHRICKAITEFLRLADAGVIGLREKRSILSSTVHILTNGSLVVDADTLLGLMIMVVVHAKVPNLEAHLYYIKNFHKEEADDGYFSYILNNLEAVIYHLLDSHFQTLAKASHCNYVFWSNIRSGNQQAIKLLVRDCESTDIPRDHFLRSRNIHGESCLMLAIKHRQHEIFQMLLSGLCITIDDILFDKNTTTNETLLVLALIEESHECAADLVDVILSESSKDERQLYFNISDVHGRSAGHYLHHNVHAIENIGPYIDWQKKDLNSHTPLFAICRCYDHPQYSTLIKRAFDCIYCTGPFNFRAHVDHGGNTLLHIISQDLPVTRLLTMPGNVLDVNRMNNKLLTPLALNVKYNRAENVEALLADKRTMFLHEDPKNFYTVCDHLAFVTSKQSFKSLIRVENAIHAHALRQMPSHSHQLAFLNAKYDPTVRDWILFLLSGTKVTAHPFKRVQFTLRMFTLKYPFYPMGDMWSNFHMEKSVAAGTVKFRINRLVEHLNVFLAALILQEKHTTFVQCLRDSENLALLSLNGALSHTTLEVAPEFLQQDVNDITSFLTYSVEELRRVQALVSRWNKVAAFAINKSADCRYVENLTFEKLLQPPLDVVTSIGESGVKHHDSSYALMHDFVARLDTEVLELIHVLVRLLVKLNVWQSHKNRLRDCTTELRRYGESDDGAADGARESTHDTFLSIFSFSDSQSKHQRLLDVQAEEKDKLVRLEREIRSEHEGVAAQIALFLKAKPKYLSFFIRRFSEDHLVLLRTHLVKLQQQSLAVIR